MVNITTCIFVVNNDSFYVRCRHIKEYGKGAVVFAEAESKYAGVLLSLKPSYVYRTYNII